MATSPVTKNEDSFQELVLAVEASSQEVRFQTAEEVRSEEFVLIFISFLIVCSKLCIIYKIYYQFPSLIIFDYQWKKVWSKIGLGVVIHF